MSKLWQRCAAFAIAASFAALIQTAGVQAQNYPSQPIRILVTIPPGGAPDVAARLLSDRLMKSLGQPVVVENRSGANGTVAGDVVAKANPDGYTLILAADSLITVNPHVYDSMPFDTMKDLVPVASVASNQFFLAVNPDLPVKTLPEFIEYARKADKPLPYASGGNGSQHQLGIEMLKQAAKIDLLHVPFRGGTPAGRATVAGETKIVLAGASSANLLQSNQLRGLATTGKNRSPAFPDLPSISEFYPDYDLTIWLGLFAPKGTPEVIQATLRDHVHKALKEKDLAEKLNLTGKLETLILAPQEFEARIRSDYEKYGKLVRDVGIKAK